MPARLKSLIGTILLVTLVIVYALVAAIFADALLVNQGVAMHFAYFLFTGLLWVLPAMAIIKWMLTPPKPRRGREV